MRWIAALTFFLALAGSALAQGPDDDYLSIYNQILQADSLQQDGQSAPAAAKYLAARSALQKFQANYPEFNKDAVTYRLGYLDDKVKELAAYMPAANGAPAAPKPAAPATPLQQIALLQDEIRTLTNANAELQMKLKEALSVQPAALAPDELAKARDRIVALEKERDLLSVDLAQLKSANIATPKSPANSSDSAKLAALQKRASEADKLAAAEIASLKKKLDEDDKKLSQTGGSGSAAKPDKSDADKIKKLTAEQDQLKKDLAAAKKEASEREDNLKNSDAAQLKKIEKERDDLQKQLAAAMQPPPSKRSAAGTPAELDRLRAEVAVLEAKPTPYTPEELAVLKSSPTAALPTMPVAANESKIHSAKDLGPGLGDLMREADSDFMAARFADAEKKYDDVLSQDKNNVYVLFHLGNAQLAAGHLDDCDKTVRRAMLLDSSDAGTLYLLGLLRYRQDKLEDALDALSRSSSLNSTNANTQNYLGCVLADKGLRPQAEAAFRKALELDPRYADAHFNLGLVYAAEVPPSLALAKWHYQKALDLGHPKNATMEKLMAESK